jgi:hypothetical protein
MIFDHIAELAGSRKKIMAGYDLGSSSAQVSYIGPDMDRPETAAAVTGTQIYNIPTVLCKRKNVNQWYYGRSAEKMAGSDQAVMVDHLLERARSGEKVNIEGEEYDPVALLTLFIKRSLSVLTFVGSIENIGGIMFTVESLDDRMISVFHTVAKNLGLDNTDIYFQDYAESLFHYMMYQPAEMWMNEVVAFQYDGGHMHMYRMDRNTHTTPTVVLIEEEITDGLRLPEGAPEVNPKTPAAEGTVPGNAVTEESAGTDSIEETAADEDRKRALERLDEQFDTYLLQTFGDRPQSCVYLLGEGFKEKWMERSLRTICQGRRVFQGNNLFSTGACCCMMDKQKPSENTSRHVYLGRDKLKSNVGMNVFRQGREEYFALLDAGTNWYEADREVECIMAEDPSISLIVTPLDGQKVHMEVLTLRNIPERPAKTTRVHIKLAMTAVDEVQVNVSDMGFGDIYRSSGQTWDFTVKLI